MRILIHSPGFDIRTLYYTYCAKKLYFVSGFIRKSVESKFILAIEWAKVETHMAAVRANPVRIQLGKSSTLRMRTNIEQEQCCGATTFLVGLWLRTSDFGADKIGPAPARTLKFVSCEKVDYYNKSFLGHIYH